MAVSLTCPAPDEKETESIELELLLQAVFKKYGYDFRNYAKAHAKRRVRHRLAMSGLKSISELQDLVLHNRDFFKTFLMDLSINVTEMFRDPGFYKALRTEVVPLLKTHPFVRVWHAGCSSGQEVYSMAILLTEEDVKERTLIYATDFNEGVLKIASEGIYPMELIREYTANYMASGGTGAFSDYYTARYGSVRLDQKLKERIVFSEHNLVTDGVFGEMNLICCRNVLIYFDRDLQNRVIKLFLDSLCPGGFLCLGSKESLKFTEWEEMFEVVDPQEKIYKKRLMA